MVARRRDQSSSDGVAHVRVALGIVGCCLAGSIITIAARDANAQPAIPAVGHVFVIVLENESYATTFGSSSLAPYLADSLPKRGALLRAYYGVGHNSLDNYIAMISGQAPNPLTRADCPIFQEFALSQPTLDANGQAVGQGCVFPAMVKTVANQLEQRGLAWRGYMEDLGNDPTREQAECGHPAIGGPDHTERAKPGDYYATKHNPFYYFHSIIHSRTSCANVVNLAHLTNDLANARTTPSFVFITPNLCEDGHDRTCPGEPDTSGGLARAGRFLEHRVPIITSSPAFRTNGLLIVTFDEASGSDTQGCCSAPAAPGPTVRPENARDGGGRVGAVVLSPFVQRPGRYPISRTTLCPPAHGRDVSPFLRPHWLRQGRQRPPVRRGRVYCRTITENPRQSRTCQCRRSRFRALTHWRCGAHCRGLHEQMRI